MPPHVPPSVCRRSVAVVGIALAFVAAVPLGARDVASASPSANLISNGSFDRSAEGWAGWYANLSVVPGGPDGSTAARATLTRPGVADFAAYTAPRAVQATAGGATYRATGWMRGLTNRRVCLAVREWAGTSMAGMSQACVTGKGRWQFASVDYTAKRTNDQIDVYVVEPSPAQGDSFDFDELTLTSSATGTTSAPPSAVTATTSASTAATRCDRVVTTTVQALVDSLGPGQTGCLVSGRTYTEDVAIRKSGTAAAPIALTSTDPTVRATLKGRLYVTDTANYWSVHDLDIDGRNASLLPSPTIAGDNTRWYNLDVTTHDAPGICFSLGSHGWGVAVGTIIEKSRIHDCGIRNNYQHGIYVAAAVGTIIRDNFIYDNGARGIQLYTDAQRSLIEHNVIDGNAEGIGIGGDGSFASSNNEIRNNIITNSFGRNNVEDYWTGPVGHGNTVHDNCVFATNTNAYYNANGGIERHASGFTAYGNRIADPLFVNRAAKDFTLRAGSSCAADAPR
jgi:hypothetical protein